MEESKNIGTGYKESHAYLEDILKKCSMMEPKYERLRAWYLLEEI